MSRVTRYAQVLVPFNALRQVSEAVAVTSVGMLAQQGDAAPKGWFLCDLSQAPAWALCNTDQTPGWASCNTSQTPGWVAVDDSQ
jgi:hypothetical protein